MRGAFHIGWRYLVFHPLKTVLLVACLTLVLFLPLALRILVGHTQRQLTSRAIDTPLLIGARGSPLELTLNSLYFDTRVPASLPYAEAARVRATGLARAIPLHVRFRTRDAPIVGTSMDYFDARGLRLAQGTHLQRLGDCVVGARVAKRWRVGPGDSLTSAPETVLDLAGVYPLKMRVTGVLDFANSPDDLAVFIDIKTAWVIEGLAHGHADVSQPDARPDVLDRGPGHVRANAAIRHSNEVTDENIGTFHFHGDVSEYPLTAIMVLPEDARSAALLMGRYLGGKEANQILEPRRVIDELLAGILTTRHYVTLGMVILGVATCLTVCLVFMLSLRLRRREIETLHKLGGEVGVVRAVCAFEMVFVLVVSLILAAGMGAATHWAGPDMVRHFLK